MLRQGFEAPFDLEGHLMVDPRGTIDWRPAEDPFTDRLRFHCCASNRRMWFINDLDKEVSFFPGDHDAIIPLLYGGVFKGTFQYTKRGSYYGIELAPAGQDQV